MVSDLCQHIDLLTVKKEDLTLTAPFTLSVSRNDCTYHRLFLFQPDESLSESMHSLRGSIFPLIAFTKRFSFRPAHMRNTHVRSKWIVPARCITSFLYFPRKTVSYTPSTITISGGQKLTDNLTCALNTRNNRDLEISISFKLDGEKQASRVDYKICVVLPCIATIVVSFNSEFNTHQSSGCDRPFLFCAHICSRSIRPRCSATCIEMCYVG